MANQKLTLHLNQSNFTDFVSKLQDLTNISDVIKLKIEKDNILAYSLLSNDVSVLALKNYLLKTSDYIDNFDSEDIFDYVIIGASKFVKNLKFFNASNPIKLSITAKHDDTNDTMHIRAAQFTNGKLKIINVGGELSKIRDIGKEALASRLNPKSAKWGFNVSKSDFSDAKKLCSINSEDRILYIDVSDGVVSLMEEGKWELQVDEISTKTARLIFNKKYLSNVNDENDAINFQIFETFILVKDNNSNLMLSFETDFTTDED
jgi:hypothetical protein